MANDQAAEARKKAEEQREKQAAAEKERAEKEQKAAADSQGANAGPKNDADLKPEPEGGVLTMDQMRERLDAQDRLIQTLTAQMANSEGPATSETKDVAVASPGAQFDPRLQRPGLASVTSAPSNQPLPMSAAGGGVEPSPDGFAAWGYAPDGSKVQAKRYKALKDTDVLVRRTGYYDDVIRNEGDIIRGYTGPAASWFIPVDDAKDDNARRRWDNLFNGRYDEGEDRAA